MVSEDGFVLQDLSLAAQYVAGAGIIGLSLSCIVALLYLGILAGFAATEYCPKSGWLDMHLPSVGAHHLGQPFAWILFLIFG